MSLIYKIINKINNKIYIGKTQFSIEERERGHLTKLRNNKHYNSHLQSSFNKYGEHVFKILLIEECNINILDEREKYWINFYKSYIDKFGYNLQLGGEGGTPNDITKLKQSKSQDINKKPVFIFDKFGNFLQKFESIKQCSRELKCSPSDIRNTINRKHYSCKGFILQKNEIFDNRLSPKDKNKNKPRNLDGTWKRKDGMHFQLSKIS